MANLKVFFVDKQAEKQTDEQTGQKLYTPPTDLWIQGQKNTLTISDHCKFSCSIDSPLDSKQNVFVKHECPLKGHFFEKCNL